MTSRPVRHRYLDPLDAAWLAVARGAGLRVTRSADVYASVDGLGTLTIGAPETLDADDCLAQMIFHELCHSLVQGEAGLRAPDWGLDNESDRDFVREHACLRVQAALAGGYGLRAVFAPTTDFRTYYDALPVDPLAEDGDPAIPIALEAMTRVDLPPWGPWVRRGLDATRTIVAAVAAIEREAPAEQSSLPTLYATYGRR